MPIAAIGDNKDFNIASRGPAQLFKVIKGSSGSKRAELDFTLAAENFTSVREYVGLALGLPVDKPEIRAALGSDVAVDGLGVDDFYRTFSKVHEHAQKWPLLEQGVRRLRLELEKFSAQLGPLVPCLERLIAEMEQRQGCAPSTEPLAEAAAQQSAKRELAATVGLMAERIEPLVDYCAMLKVNLDDFRRELKNDVLQELHLKLFLSEPALNSKELKALDARVQLAQRGLDCIHEEFRALETEAWGVFSEAGESTDAVKCVYAIRVIETNWRLQAAQTQVGDLMSELGALRQTMPNLRALVQHISQLEHSMFVADIGLTQLLDIWNATLTWGRRSTSALEPTPSVEKLQIFGLELKAITDPWVEIGRLMKQ